jgi:hypothetical protein
LVARSVDPKTCLIEDLLRSWDLTIMVFRKSRPVTLRDPGAYLLDIVHAFVVLRLQAGEFAGKLKGPLFDGLSGPETSHNVVAAASVFPDTLDELAVFVPPNPLLPDGH